MHSLTKAIGTIFQPLLKLVAEILAFLYSVIPNYPIDVALLTIIIMAVLTPLTVKSTKSMAAMQALGPEMKKLQQKYKGTENRAQLNEEMMKLYKEHAVNPASGCLPMLLQMPAFLILYDVIRGITNTVTVHHGAMLSNGVKCAAATCANAEPRYISHGTSMYHAIVNADPPGSLHAFGFDFANKLLSHHSAWYVAIPYLLLVAASVGLQYFQMSRLNARNPSAAQANPQAAMIQKYMPIIFGLIYINVAALINVYFIVSSAIRIGTQEVLFRKGIIGGPAKAGAISTTAKVKAPPEDQAERALPRARATKPGTPGKGGGSRAGSTAKGGTTRAGAPGGGGASSGVADVATEASSAKGGGTGGARTRGGGAAARRANTTKNGANPNGATDDADRQPARSGTQANRNRSRRPGGAGSAQQAASAKQHPRSKAKRERKAR